MEVEDVLEDVTTDEVFEVTDDVLDVRTDEVELEAGLAVLEVLVEPLQVNGRGPATRQ